MNLRTASMCPKCFRHGSLGSKCPHCGTETFPFPANNTCEPPKKTQAKAWKKFLKNPLIKATLDIYNEDPVPDWRTHREEKYEQQREIRSLMELRRQHKKRARENREASKETTITIEGVVAVKKNVVLPLEDPKHQSVWFQITIGSYYDDSPVVYNGITVAKVYTDKLIGRYIGVRKRPTRKFQKKLDAAVRKFVNGENDGT